MMQRLREGFSGALAALAARIRLRRRGGRSSNVKGCMRNIIVIKPPDPMFVEAVFILRDDYFSSSALSSHELLLQARDAAQSYVDSVIPPVRRPQPPLWPALLLLIPAAALLTLWLAGLL